MEKINNVYCIAGMMADSNSYLIDNSDSDSDFDHILVDTGIGGSKDYLSSQLSEIGLSLEDIDLVVNTHCHYDHVGGNCLFPNAKVAIGEIDGDCLEDPENPVPICFVPAREIKRRDVDIRLKEGDRIADFEVLETPGHIDIWRYNILPRRSRQNGYWRKHGGHEELTGQIIKT